MMRVSFALDDRMEKSLGTAMGMVVGCLAGSTLIICDRKMEVVESVK